MRPARIAPPLLTLLVVLLAGVATSPAHHNTEEMIRQFTEQIEAKGDKAAPELYYRRATEYRVLREFGKAEADLEKAIAIAPEYVAAHEATRSRPPAARGSRRGARIARTSDCGCHHRARTGSLARRPCRDPRGGR